MNPNCTGDRTKLASKFHHRDEVLNITFLAVPSQIQGFLEETDDLDPFQSGFKQGYGTETALVILVADLSRATLDSPGSLRGF